MNISVSEQELDKLKEGQDLGYISYSEFIKSTA